MRFMRCYSHCNKRYRNLWSINRIYNFFVLKLTKKKKTKENLIRIIGVLLYIDTCLNIMVIGLIEVYIMCYLLTLTTLFRVFNFFSTMQYTFSHCSTTKMLQDNWWIFIQPYLTNSLLSCLISTAYIRYCKSDSVKIQVSRAL